MSLSLHSGVSKAQSDEEKTEQGKKTVVMRRMKKASFQIQILSPCSFNLHQYPLMTGKLLYEPIKHTCFPSVGWYVSSLIHVSNISSLKYFLSFFQGLGLCVRNVLPLKAQKSKGSYKCHFGIRVALLYLNSTSISAFVRTRFLTNYQQYHLVLLRQVSHEKRVKSVRVSIVNIAPLSITSCDYTFSFSLFDLTRAT